ncbi:hypothetical protein B0H14DRAFT_3659681 [Mycena olivaceomarginata]|nr:hypothetical protein B0H14DRAFT_3659681 [Mycena olivaceomarginata]
MPVDFSGLAVSWSEAAVALTPDGHPEKPSWLNNLANSLLDRFEWLGDLTDIDNALYSEPLLRRFERFDDLTDINHAVSKLEGAVGLVPEGDPHKPVTLVNLGTSLLCRFERFHDHHDFETMLDQFTQAASSPTGRGKIRFNAAKLWGKYAQRYRHSSLMHAYTTAVNLLPELAWPGLSIRDQHYRIQEAGQVVRNAAAAAIADHQYSTAVEWLEQGRSVTWAQILGLRTPVDELRKDHPELADELISISTQLERGAVRSRATEPATGGPSESLKSIAHRSHILAERRAQLLKQIRHLDGFKHFCWKWGHR